jgi:uncharacterized membrane protein YozB (DUF420 family)
VDLAAFPAINASLNAMCAFFLILGYIFIKQRAITAHTMCMLAATCVSILFLGFYLYYHFHHGSTKFQGTGLIRPIYFAILLSHTILAVVQLPLIILTLYRGLAGQFPRHVAVARITFPIWLYVSITGVVVYWMLYRL